MEKSHYKVLKLEVAFFSVHIWVVNFEVENFELQILDLIYCTEEDIYTANWHMLIFCAKKSGAGWVGGWMDGW